LPWAQVEVEDVVTALTVPGMGRVVEVEVQYALVQFYFKPVSPTMLL
jgi:hypothetical protein